MSSDHSYKKSYEIGVDTDVGILMRDGVCLSACVHDAANPSCLLLSLVPPT